MRYKNIVAIFLIAGIVLGMVGGAIVLSVKDRNGTLIGDDTLKTQGAEELTLSATLPPMIAESIPSEQITPDETAEVNLNVEKIERESCPDVIDSRVEYATKECANNEES